MLRIIVKFEIKAEIMFKETEKREYYLKNCDKNLEYGKEYLKNRKKEVSFRLIRNTRRKIQHAVNCTSEQISTKKF